ncbi:MAG: UPF0182 family membrane protein [Acidimicrobiia bacterium]
MISREPTAFRPRANRRGLTIAIVIVVILLLTLRGLATFWTDFLWFQSVNLESVWSTLLVSRVAPVVAASIVAFLLLWVNLVFIDRISPRFQLIEASPEEEIVERFQEWVEPRIRRVRFALAILFGILVGLGTSVWWEDILLYFNRTSFGVTDPIFGRDISFYVFQLPLLRDLYSWGFQLLVLTTILVAALHYLNGGIRLRQGRAPQVSPGVKAHLSVLVAGLAILKAADYRLDSFDLLYSTRGVVFGASYTDVKAQLPALSLLALISLFAAVLLLWNIRRRGWTLPIVAVGGWLAMSIIVAGIIPAAIQRFSVVPDELNKELPYITNAIDFTRRSYGLDKIQVRQFAASPALDFQGIEANRPTVDNIRLWDPAVLTETYSRLQEIRTYYSLDNVDVDRYSIDGQLTQVMVATRELAENADVIEGWVNEHLIYTHGFGAVLSPANSVDPPQGQPAFLVKDVPPQAEDPSLAIDQQPRVYFGESYGLDRFVIVGTKQQEVDFPLTAEGQSVSYNNYDGAGGVRMGSIFRRAAFALRYSDLNSLLSNQVTSDSKVLMRRNVADQVRTAAPFLYADNDPYMTIIDGRLIWIVDMYTISDRYPYSIPADVSRLGNGVGTLPNSFNYIRNSVKATVDAYDGTMTFYVVDPADPLITAYRQIFPELFVDGSTMPPALIDHLRYPEDMYRVQSDMYRLFHMTDPSTFYQEEDAWEIPSDPSNAQQEEVLRGPAFIQDFNPITPYYLLMTLPEEEALSYLILQPFNPVDRPNMASFLVAKSGPEAYGEIIDYRLPRTAFVDGPTQVGALINQNPDISQQFTLWNQQGSNVIKGNLLVVPIDESVVYFQPVYLQGSQDPLPEFKRVVVVFNDRIVMRETLAQALAEVFGGEVAPTEPGTVDVSGDIEQLLQRADQAFADADAALQSGDLGLYQQRISDARQQITRAMELLGELTGG